MCSCSVCPCSDLYGAIGHPLRVARTVVVGRRADLVNRLLYVLSYFIRCSDVHEAPFSRCLSAVLQAKPWDRPSPPTPTPPPPGATRSVSTDEGSVTPVEEASACPGDFPSSRSRSQSRSQSHSQAGDPSADDSVCGSCGSCSSALHFYSDKGRKLGSALPPSPVRTVVGARVEGGERCGCKGPHRTVGSGVESVERHRCKCEGQRTQSSRDSVEGERCACEGQRKISTDASGVERERCQCESQRTQQSSRDSSCVACQQQQQQQQHKHDRPRFLPTTVPEGEGHTLLSDDSGIENSDSYDKSSSRNPKRATDASCKMLAVHVVEDSRLENVRHVRRSAQSSPVTTLRSPSEEEDRHRHASASDGKQDWSSSKRPVSMLARQLAADSKATATAAAAAAALEKQKARKREVQKQFLAGGSSSMFEEYFEGDVETKTIDDVSEHEIVVKHPLVSSSAGPPTSPTPSGRGEEGGGLGQPKGSVMSRQNSMDTKPHVSRPTSLNPARCR